MKNSRVEWMVICIGTYRDFKDEENAYELAKLRNARALESRLEAIEAAIRTDSRTIREYTIKDELRRRRSCK